MGKLYVKLFSDEILTEAWHHTKQGTDSAGSDGVSLAQYQRYLFLELKALQRDLCNRRYHPQPIKRLSIPKADGRARPIGILTARDRIVQAAILKVIEPLFDVDFEDISYAFRQGRSTQMAIDRLEQRMREGLPWLVHLDINSFFDEINLAKLEKQIFRKVRDSELKRLVRFGLKEQALKTERVGLFRRPRLRGILQGGILSPLYGNIYLDQFDKSAIRAGLKLIRYADDIILLCSSQEMAKRHLGIAQRLLASLDLLVNLSKTEIVHAYDGLTFLGKAVLLEKWQVRTDTKLAQPDDSDPHETQAAEERALK